MNPPALETILRHQVSFEQVTEVWSRNVRNTVIIPRMFSKWFWAQRRRKRQIKLARIAELQKKISEIWEAETRNAKTREAREEAFGIANAETEYDQNELDSLLQENLMRAAKKIGLAIPANYYEGEWPLKRTLSYEGVVWTRREINKMRRANFKSWSEIIVPILALLVALVSVLANIFRR